MARHGRAGRRGGCTLPILLVLFIAAALWQGRDEQGVPRRPGLFDRRDEALPEFGIADEERRQDSQGTAFAVGTNGLWLTAEHVVRGCARIGLATGPGQAQRVVEVHQSPSADAALIADGMPGPIGLALAATAPLPGARGYHMGYPAGEPAIVESELIGPGNAVRGSGRSEAVLAWAEIDRFPDFDHTLGGISGGPTLDSAGQVVGINSAASERRGRVLTTRPGAGMELVRAVRHSYRPAAEPPIAGLHDAVRRFRHLSALGAIRPVYCDVAE